MTSIHEWGVRISLCLCTAALVLLVMLGYVGSLETRIADLEEESRIRAEAKRAAEDSDWIQCFEFGGSR